MPPDFFLWMSVHNTSPTATCDMRARIREAFINVSPVMLPNFVEGFRKKTLKAGVGCAFLYIHTIFISFLIVIENSK